MVVAGAVVVATKPPLSPAIVVVAVAVVVATKPPLSRSNSGRSHQVAVEPQPCFVTKSVNFRFCELSFGVSSSKSRDLQSGHGFRTCSLKKQRKIGFTYSAGGKETKPVPLHRHKLGQIGEELLVKETTEF